MPVDSTARARLRDAQAAEGRALTAVETADRALANRRQSVQARIGRLEEQVRAAGQIVLKQRKRLVEVSGLDRAALLLGLTPKDLKRSISRLEHDQDLEHDVEEEDHTHNGITRRPGQMRQHPTGP